MSCDSKKLYFTTQCLGVIGVLAMDGLVVAPGFEDKKLIDMKVRPRPGEEHWLHICPRSRRHHLPEARKSLFKAGMENLNTCIPGGARSSPRVLTTLLEARAG